MFCAASATTVDFCALLAAVCCLLFAADVAVAGVSAAAAVLGSCHP